MIAISSAALIAIAPVQTVDIFFAPIRVDCEVKGTRHFFQNVEQTEPWGSSTYVFLFPDGGKAGDAAYVVHTRGDGHSQLYRKNILQFEEGGWPRFSAVLGELPWQIRLIANPQVKGQITFEAFPNILTDGGGAVLESGICRITTDPTRIKGK